MTAEARHDALTAELAAVRKQLNGIVSEYLTAALKAAEEHAGKFTSYAQMIAAKRVDRNTVAETHEVAKVLTGVQADCQWHIGHAADTVKATGAALTQLKNSHDGIQEAFHRSPVDQRELAQVSPDWITPQ